MAIAFFHTWTTYGTWLPGDARGWLQRGSGVRSADALRERQATLRMTESAIILTDAQRLLVEGTVADHCRIRGWTLHAVNCRTNHVHAIVTAPTVIEMPREQFKAWCTRRLKATLARKNWWTQCGWDEYIDDEEELAAVIAYVLEGQE